MAGELIGYETPRLWTPPLRPLTRDTTNGYAVCDFADQVVGEPLLPWERFLVIHAMELLPDRTYRFRTVLALAARQNGKTHTKKIIRLWKMYVGGAKVTLGVAQDVTTAKEFWQACLNTIESVPELRAELANVRRANGEIEFQLTNGARYIVRAANRSAPRGLAKVEDLDFEEVREQLSWDAWSALSKTTRAAPSAQTWALSNAGDVRSVVLNHLRSAAGIKQDADGVSYFDRPRDPSIGIFEWSAREGCDLDDREAWCQANPGLGHIISERAIMSDLTTDPPAIFRTEVLCQKVDSLDSAIDLGAWKTLADTGTMDSVRDRVVLCFDVAPDGAHATLAAAAEVDDGRIRVEAISHWTDMAEARRELPGLIARVGPRAVGWFPSGPGAAFAAVFKRPELPADPAVADDEIDYVALQGGDVTQACMGLAQLVDERRIITPGDPLLDTHAANAQKLQQGDGWRFVRRDVGHVDAMYAVAGAVYLTTTMPFEIGAPSAIVL